MYKKYFLLAISSIVITGMSDFCAAQPYNYPKPRKAAQVDTYFGGEVKDPYRWMEDDHSAETGAWVKAENELTQSYLQKYPFRDSLLARMTALWNYPQYTAPFKAGAPGIFILRIRGCKISRYCI